MNAISLLNKSLSEYTSPLNLSGKYRSWHVEALLNQASDLLDRCVSDRRELQSLDAKKTEAELKLAASLAESNLLASRLERNWYAFSIQDFDNAQFQTFLTDYKNALTTTKDYAHNLAFEPPGPSNSKNMSEYSALAQVKKAEADFLEKNLQIDRLRGDLEPLIVSYRAIIENAENEKLAHELGGSLNFDTQINGLRSRIIDDFKDACDRLSVASIGLKRFYAYETPLPLPVDKPGITPTTTLDDICLWTRAAIRWMVASAQYEQVFTCQLSARTSTDPLIWEQSIQKLLATGQTSFALWLDSNKFNDYRFCRFRGISAFAIGTEEVWSAFITLPTLAVSVQINTEGNEVLAKLNQEDLPSCRLGRVQNRQAAREPEIGGANSLRNASPFGYQNDNSGKLSIQISWPFEIPPAELIAPEDFQFEFYMAGLPK